ncbi:hypothetical protein ACL02T_08145 [Pseudonocardia sp. RS010]
MIVPLHRTIVRGTLGSILRKAGLSAAEVLGLLPLGLAADTVVQLLDT